jgi:hypothetical protein
MHYQNCSAETTLYKDACLRIFASSRGVSGHLVLVRLFLRHMDWIGLKKKLVKTLACYGFK